MSVTTLTTSNLEVRLNVQGAKHALAHAGSTVKLRRAMTNSRTETDYEESDELLMNEDADFVEEELEEDQEERTSRPRGFNLDMRHRIEDKLEERRLLQELNEYEFFELDDDEETLH